MDVNRLGALDRQGMEFICWAHKRPYGRRQDLARSYHSMRAFHGHDKQLVVSLFKIHAA